MKSRIRQALKEKGLTLTRLADELGVTLQSVSESLGREGEAPLNYIAATVRLTGYRFEWLVNGDGPKTDDELVRDPLREVGISERNVYALIADLYKQVQALQQEQRKPEHQLRSPELEQFERYMAKQEKPGQAAEPNPEAADVSAKPAKKKGPAS